jgi:hypothetical protein
MDKNQETRFTHFLREKAKEAERAIRYRPTYFLGMLETVGGYRTALKLLSANDVSEGFVKLWEHRRLDLSVEALVVESEWRQVFDPVLLALAEKKLKNAKYPFIRWDGGKSHADAKTPVVDGAIEVARTTRENCIVIAWPGGDEYIDIDLDALGEDTDIYFTKQTYEDGSKLDIYEVSSIIRALDDGRYEIKIRYDSAKNPDITDNWWGATHIVMRRDASTGIASWYDEHDKRRNGSFNFRTEYTPEDGYSQRWKAEDLALTQRPDLEETVKQVLRNERRGQHVFRERVLQRELACRLTGVDDAAHLRASHIKPWAESDQRERLDGNNGLMLAPHADHLFDRAYISFEDDGKLLVLNDDIEQLLQRWGIDRQKNPSASKPFNPQQCAYLAHHRQRFASRLQQA